MRGEVTAEEIRAFYHPAADKSALAEIAKLPQEEKALFLQYKQLIMLGEIAAQLAELVEHTRKVDEFIFEKPDYKPPAKPKDKQCSEPNTSEQ